VNKSGFTSSKDHKKHRIKKTESDKIAIMQQHKAMMHAKFQEVISTNEIMSNVSSGQYVSKSPAQIS
jgi:hypothetical protein